MPTTHNVMAAFIVTSPVQAHAVRLVEEWVIGERPRPWQIMTARVTPSGQFPVDAPSGWLKQIATLIDAAQTFVNQASLGVDPTDQTSIEVTAEYRKLVEAVASYEDFDERSGRPPGEPGQPDIDWKAAAFGLTKALSTHERSYTDLLKVLENCRGDNAKMADELVRMDAEVKRQTANAEQRYSDSPAKELDRIRPEFHRLQEENARLKDAIEADKTRLAKAWGRVDEAEAIARRRPGGPVGTEAIIQGLKYLNAELNAQQGLLNDQIARLKEDVDRRTAQHRDALERIQLRDESYNDQANRFNDYAKKSKADRDALQAVLEHSRTDHADAERRLSQTREDLDEERRKYESCCRDRAYWQDRAFRDEKILAELDGDLLSGIEIALHPAGGYDRIVAIQVGSYQRRPPQDGAQTEPASGDQGGRVHIVHDPHDDAGARQTLRTSGLAEDARPEAHGRAAGGEQTPGARAGEQGPGTLRDEPGGDQTNPDRPAGAPYRMPRD